MAAFIAKPLVHSAIRMLYGADLIKSSVLFLCCPSEEVIDRLRSGVVYIVSAVSVCLSVSKISVILTFV